MTNNELNKEKPQKNYYQDVKSLISFSFKFTLIYACFSIAFLFLCSFAIYPALNKLSDTNNNALITGLALYFIVVFTIFTLLGVCFSKRSPSLIKQIISTLPVIIIGLLIWYFSYIHAKRINDNFSGWSWLLYDLYIIWTVPVSTFIEDFVSNIHLEYLALLPLVIPSVFFIIGTHIGKYFGGDTKIRKVILSSIVLPIGLIILLAISIFMPSSKLFTQESYPRVDGATAAVPFAQILYKQLTGASAKKSKEVVKFNTTHDAYVNLIERKTDIIFVAGPSNEELKLASDNGIKMNLTAIGKDAFIFVAHKDNPVNNLTINQIRDIYSGKIFNWREVGGEDSDIIAYQREKNSGSQTFMENKVMKDIELTPAPQEKKIDSMGGLIDSVADYKNAKNSLGYSFYYFANEMHKSEAIKFLSVEGVECNKENIINAKYPYTAILYAVTRSDEPADSPASKLLKFIQSADGNELISKGGFIPFHK
ncbi:MAG: substrate-binding domain-containing protein [Bacillota bacterium]|nr:substrate-binding domain-containing protein [Bacillota bacterium]